jgi:hypothetical protein
MCLWCSFLVQPSDARSQNFFGGESGHTAPIDGAGFEEAGAAGDFVADNGDGGAEGTGPGGLGGAKNGDSGFAEESGQMHRTTVVTEDEAGVSKPVSEFKSRGFS